MILLATNKRDITTDFVVLELRRQGLNFFRLNTEDIWRYSISMPSGDPALLALDGPAGSLRLPEVTAAYYRRPGLPEVERDHASVDNYRQAEWSAVMRSLWNALEQRWLNCPFAILRAEDKPRQIAVAQKAGFRVPETLVSNDFNAAASFCRSHPTVIKPLRQALIESDQGDSVLFTSRIQELCEEYAVAVSLAPAIYQHEIIKRFDVRVIVIDQSVFSANIHSQANEETETDWRKGTRTDLLHEATELPLAVSDACIDVVSRLGLRFAAIDLVQDIEGNYWFLEANPNGQWAWIEQRTGAPISAAIVQGLTK